MSAVAQDARAPAVRRPVAALSLALVLAALPVVACTPEAPCGLEICDIRSPSCQQAVSRATGCLRGYPDVRFPVRLKAQAEYIAEAEAAAAAATPEELGLYSAWQAALARFGLGDPDLSPTASAREQASWVAAYYDTEERAVTVIDAGHPLRSPEAVTLLVHESTHALQDQIVGLRSFHARVGEGDLDRALTGRSVTEGEATLVEDLAALGLFGARAGEVGWQDIFATWQRWMRQDAGRSSLPVDLAWAHFPYAFGSPQVFAAFQARGWAGVDELYAAPPASTAQILGHLAGVPAFGDGRWSEELGEQAVPQLPEGGYVDGDRLGAWIFSVFVDRYFNLQPTDDRRARWQLLSPLRTLLRADHFSVFAGGLGVWRLRFSDAQAAAQVAGALAPDSRSAGGPSGGPWQAWSLERDVILVGGAARDLRGVAFGPVPAPTAPATRTLAPHAHLLRCRHRLGSP